MMGKKKKKNIQELNNSALYLTRKRLSDSLNPQHLYNLRFFSARMTYKIFFLPYLLFKVFHHLSFLHYLIVACIVNIYTVKQIILYKPVFISATFCI